MSERTSTDIQRDIDRTRAEMSDTIDAIQDRLSPGQMVDQFVWHLRHDSGASEFAANLGRTIRDNPVPVVLIGTGLVWLMFASGRRRAQRYGYETEDYYDEEAWLEHYGTTEEAAERYDERMRRGERVIERDTDPAHAGHYGSAPGPYGTATSTPRSADPTARRPGLSGSTVGAAAVTPGGPGDDAGDQRGQSASERARQAANQARERAAHASTGPEHVTHTAGPASASGSGGESRHETGGDWQSKGRERAEQAGESAKRGMDEARERFERAGERARQGMGRAGEYTREQAKRARQQARRRAQRAGGAFSRLFREQPLLVGVLGLAVGAAIGALLPATRRENEWLGETGDELKQRAREEAARARRIAERTMEAAREEAKRQGLTPEGAKEELRRAQHAAGEALKETQHDVQEALKRTAEEKLHETEDAARGKAHETEDRFRKVGEAAKDAAKEEAKRDSSGSSRPGQGT